MKKMKRLLVVLLAALCVFGTAGCGSDDSGSSGKGSGKDLIGIWETNYDIGAEVAQLVKDDYGLKLSKDLNKIFVMTARVEFKKDDTCKMYILEDSLGSGYERSKREFLDLAVEAMYDAAEKNKKDLSADEFIELIEDEENCSIREYLEYCIWDVIDIDNLSDYTYLEGTYETKKNKLYVEDEDNLLEDIEYVTFSIEGDVLTIGFPEYDFIDELLPGVKNIIFTRVEEEDRKPSAGKQEQDEKDDVVVEEPALPEPVEPAQPEPEPTEEPAPVEETPEPVVINEIIGTWAWKWDLGTMFSNLLSEDADLGDAFEGFYSPLEMEILVEFRDNNVIHMSVNWSDEDFQRWCDEFIDYAAEAIYIYIAQQGLSRSQADAYFLQCYGYTVGDYVRTFLPDEIESLMDLSFTEMDEDAGYYGTEGDLLYFGDTMEELYTESCDRVFYSISGNTMTWTELPGEDDKIEALAMLDELGGVEFPVTLERR